jgi:hypothetical protein
VIIDKLTDHEGSLLFPEDRVMDVLENRGAVRVFITALGNNNAVAKSEGGGDGAVSKYTTALTSKIKKRKVPAVGYVRDDARFEYVTPAAEELLAPGRVTGRVVALHSAWLHHGPHASILLPILTVID